MASSIPASAIVSVLPSVIDAGGNGLDLIGLILTDSTRTPVNTVLPFASAADVAAYYGALSTEATMAAAYFAGYDGSTIKPASLKFYRYVGTAAAAFLRGGKLAQSLTTLQGRSGTLTVTINGTAKTSSTINLSAATSYSDAAAIIQAGFTSPGFTVTYDSLFDAFVFTSSTTGAASTLTYATGTLASGVKLTASAGAVLSQGSDVVAAGATMDAATAISQDFVSFSTTFNPSTTVKTAFAVWVDGKNSRFLYVPWEVSDAAALAGDTTTIGPICTANDYSSVAPVYDPTDGTPAAAFLMGAIASLNFTRENGRATMAFRTGNVNPGVTNQTIAANLTANGYNYFGRYATANDSYVFLYPGQVSGAFKWIDSWVSQAWMNNAFQSALMNLLTSIGQIPYNQDGYSLIESALRGVIDDALNFGAIRAGVTLSSSQKAEVNSLAGGDIAGTIERRGWYVLIKDPGATARANRQSPNCTIFYTDGQSVQQITLSSVSVL
jgi:hypothetical protein